MFERLNVFNIAYSMATHAGKRQALISENMANADTPGYHAKDIKPFKEVFAAGATQGDMVATRGPGRVARALAPGGRYRAVGGTARVLLALVFGGRLHSRGGRSIGMLMVPSGQDTGIGCDTNTFLGPSGTSGGYEAGNDSVLIIDFLDDEGGTSCGAETPSSITLTKL